MKRVTTNRTVISSQAQKTGKVQRLGRKPVAPSGAKRGATHVVIGLVK